MRTTIDNAGRLVLPKQLREQVGIRSGEVDVYEDGSGLKVEPVTTETLVERDGLLIVPRSGHVVEEALVEKLRDADRR